MLQSEIQTCYHVLPFSQVVGEYAYLLEELEMEEILESVTELLNRRFEDTDTHGWAISAITKLVSQLGHLPDSVQSQLALYLTSTNTDIQQVSSMLHGCAPIGIALLLS